jgi:hypothetical protein
MSANRRTVLLSMVAVLLNMTERSSRPSKAQDNATKWDETGGEADVKAFYAVFLYLLTASAVNVIAISISE